MAAATGRADVPLGSPGRGKDAASRAAAGRRCLFAECATILSTYNASATCWLHSDPKFRRVNVVKGRNERDMTPGTTATAEDKATRDHDVDEYFCPVCGIGLARSDFETPERDYYCPFCTTRQTPAVV
jgi:hypothetical protein